MITIEDSVGDRERQGSASALDSPNCFRTLLKIIIRTSSSVASGNHSNAHGGTITAGLESRDRIDLGIDPPAPTAGAANEKIRGIEFLAPNSSPWPNVAQCPRAINHGMRLKKYESDSIVWVTDPGSVPPTQRPCRTMTWPP